MKTNNTKETMVEVVMEITQKRSCSKGGENKDARVGEDPIRLIL